MPQRAHKLVVSFIAEGATVILLGSYLLALIARGRAAPGYGSPAGA